MTCLPDSMLSIAPDLSISLPCSPGCSGTAGTCVLAPAGAKSLGDTVELLIKWGDGSKGRVPSRRLFGKVHCLESLVLFYETKTRKRKGNDGAAERQA